MTTKVSHVCAIDCMLEGSFVAMASGLKPRPSLLYLEAQINGKNVSCLVNIGATHSFMSPKLARELPNFANVESGQVHQRVVCKRRAA